MNKLFSQMFKRTEESPSNITISDDGGVHLNLQDPDTQRRLLEVLKSFEEAQTDDAPVE